MKYHLWQQYLIILLCCRNERTLHMSFFILPFFCSWDGAVSSGGSTKSKLSLWSVASNTAVDPDWSSSITTRMNTNKQELPLPKTGQKKVILVLYGVLTVQWTTASSKGNRSLYAWLPLTCTTGLMLMPRSTLFAIISCFLLIHTSSKITSPGMFPR